MNHVRVAQLLVNAPLAIHEHKLTVILDAIAPRLFGQEIEPRDVDDHEVVESGPVVPDEPGARSVAMIPIVGTLVNRTMGLQALSGLTSYHAIRAQVQFALDNPGIEGIILDMDSPGGEVNGLLDLADFLREAATIKPMIAVVDEQAFSAAYILASAAREVIVPRTGGVGSVGVLAVHVDQSAHDQQEGLKYTFITSAERKADLNPHVPLSSDAQQQLQERVDQVYALTADTVVRHRGISREILDELQGGTVFGEEALEVGLASKIQSKEDAIEAFLMALTRQPRSLLVGSPSFNGGGNMAKPKTIILKNTSAGSPPDESAGVEPQAQQDQASGQAGEAQKETGVSGEVASVAKGLGLPEQTVQHDLQNTHFAGGAASEDETFKASYVMEVLGVCRMAGRPELAEKFIAKRISLEAVRNALQNAQAQADEAIKIVGTPPPDTTEETAKTQPIDAAAIFANRQAQMSGRA